MAEKPGNRPSEIFGYPTWNQSVEAREARRQHWCPFQDRTCNKKSRLISFPFGVCSAKHGDGLRAICPHRFDEPGSIEGVSRVLEDVASHYFGDLDNLVAFSEVRLPNVGNIDHVLVRHKPMKPEVDDFVSVEYQSDSTTSTGGLVQAIREFAQGVDVNTKTYSFGMNTYDSIKRAVTQLMNKGIVYEAWDAKCYWVIQEYIYENLGNRYAFKSQRFSPSHASRFALYDLVATGDSVSLQLVRFISTTVDEVYQAMRNNPGIPKKDDFVSRLNSRLRLGLNIQVSR